MKHRNFHYVLCAMLLIFPALSYSQGLNLPVESRGSVTLGPWMSSFTESDSTHSTSMTSRPSLGFQLEFGAQLNLIFVEYTLSWFLPQHAIHAGQPQTNDSVYYSLVGGILGISLPLLPIEAYVGVDQGNYRLSSGTGTKFYGLTPKIGVTISLPNTGKKEGASFAIRGEYSRVFARGDDAGALPSSITARSSIYFIGLVLGAPTQGK